jgi:hypothetical protein
VEDEDRVKVADKVGWAVKAWVLAVPAAVLPVETRFRTREESHATSEVALSAAQK